MLGMPRLLNAVPVPFTNLIPPSTTVPLLLAAGVANNEKYPFIFPAVTPGMLRPLTLVTRAASPPAPTVTVILLIVKV